MNTEIALYNSGMLDNMSKLAQMMSVSQNALPLAFQGNVGDCLAVVIQAQQWGMNPYAIAQKTSFINGNISYEAQLVNSVINKLAPIEHRIKYEFFGDWTKIIGKVKAGKSSNGKNILVSSWAPEDEDGLGVTVYTTLKGESEPRKLDVLLAQAQVRNSPLWVSDPKQQLCYLAVKKWSRLFCPDVIMGVYTPDEAMEFEPQQVIEATPVSILREISEASTLNGLIRVYTGLTDEEKDEYKDEFTARKEALLNDK